MASQKTKFAVGLFLVGGISVALVALIWLGVTRFFEKGHFYVTYFTLMLSTRPIVTPLYFTGPSFSRPWTDSLK